MDSPGGKEEVRKGRPKASPAFLASLKGSPPASEPKPSLKTQEVAPPAKAAALTQAASPPASPVFLPPAKPQAALPVDVVSHAALDSIFFCKTFFPKTFRQEAAPFHADLWSILNDPAARYVNVVIGRDGAKTTILRAFAAKRIGYGISRTILYIGASQDKAKQSVGWLKSQILSNRVWTETFGLRRAQPFSDEHVTIQHGVEKHIVHIVAYGITGSTRGINLDDWRPDLIIVDDCMTDENSATPESRHKVINLILGSIKESLSPASESPDAKMVLLNTPQDFEDLSQEALKDPQFRSASFGCWTSETEDLPVEEQISSWEARYPSEVLRKEKLASITRNRYSIFAREKECRLITPETSHFRPEWLQYFGPEEAEKDPPAHETWVELVIDPVPPPSEVQIAKGLVGKDYEALTAVGRWKNKYYVLETVYNRGHQPNWTVATFFEMCNRWKPRKVIVEAIAYQATLAWLLREGMKRTGRFYPIEEFKDKRKKGYRIQDGLAGPASNGAFYVRRSQTTLISQFIHHPGKNPSGTHDDVLETAAIGVASLSKGYVGDIDVDHYQLYENQVPALEVAWGCP